MRAVWSSRWGFLCSILRILSSLAGVVALALVMGLLYVSVVPPWQHYDEPTHFEYAWLIANRPGLPETGDYDQAMRREVAASMVEHDFYRGMDYVPDLLQSRPIGIGYSELRHPPLYYVLVSLPLRLIRHADITVQLYAARGVSLVLLLFSVVCAYHVVAELTGEGHVLRWAVPGMMALLPGYVDLMTAVNNDVGAVLVFSVFLWGAVRLIRRGVTVSGIIWVVGAAGLCVWTKNTVAVAVALAPLALLLAGVPDNWRRRTWAGIAVMGVVLVGAVLTWGDAALWYRGRGTTQGEATRQRVDEVPFGEYALTVVASPEEPAREVLQLLLREEVRDLRGETVVLGAWMWAGRPVEVRSPALCDGQGECAWESVKLTTEPTFHAITSTVSAEAERIEVRLRPWRDGIAEPVAVYYDGIVLTDEGEALEGGSLAGWSSTNLIRNGSAETAWPWVRPWAEERLGGMMPWPHSLSLVLGSVMDWQRTGWVYRPVGLSLLKTFWARFGWAHVRVPRGWYWGVGAATVLGWLGAMAATARRWAGACLLWRRAVVCLAVCGLVVWGSVVLRPHPLMGNILLPVARYAFPVIIPTALALMGGWLAFVPGRWKGKAAAALLAGLAVLNVVSLTTIWRFYQGA